MSEASDASRRAHFEKAFVVTSYLLGRTTDEKLVDFRLRTVEGNRIANLLTKGERRQRAVVVAAEWGQVIVALSRRRFGTEPVR